ncbi:hypothetical protein FMM82_21400 [[Clostridium] clostridioforme]|nr:hypothetical protein [Enterocloster clostridioformis]
MQNYIITKGCFLFIPFYGLHKFPLPEIYFTLLFAVLVSAIKQADKECGSCGCELDPLYKKALELI